MSGTFSDSIDVLTRMGSLRVKRLFNLPAALAKSTSALVTGKMPHVSGGVNPDEIQKHIRIPVEGNATAEAMSLASEMATLAGKGEWGTIADRLRALEIDRSMTQGGDTLYGVIPSVLEEVIVYGAGDLDERPDATWRDRLAWLEAEFDKSPDDHVLAALVARAHVAIGWAYRGGGWADDVDEEAWKALAYHSGVAVDILSRFDALQLNSPVIAHAWHMTARWEPDKHRLRKSFADWRLLDPTCIDAMREHSFFLLPRWGGTYFGLELFARRMVRETEDRIGLSAYAAIYLSLLGTEPTLTEIVHAPTFRQGVLDLVERFNSPATVNRCLSVIAQLANELAEEVKEPDVVEWEKMLADLLFVLVTQHLDALVPDIWDEPDLAWCSIGACYRAELEKGATISFRKGSAPLITYS